MNIIMNHFPPIYNPPYDSPLEDNFAYHFVKYLKEDVDFIPQAEINSICGNFYIDFLVCAPSGEKVAFECDGKEFHNESRDEWRDAMILGSSEVGSIYRLRGADITYHINDVLFVISRYNPEIFSIRGIRNLNSLASSTVINRSFEPTNTMDIITYLDKKTNQINHLFIERHHKNIPNHKRQFWQAAYKFALEIGGGNLDDIISSYRNKRII